MQFTVTRDCYEEGDYLFSKDSFEIFPNKITVLVGCNGSGKSTLLQMIKRQCEKSNITCQSFDNISDGGTHSRSADAFHEDFASLASKMCSSEGEELSINIGQFLGRVGRTVRTLQTGDKLFVLLDASDSGASIDRIQELKNVFNELVISDANKSGVELYVVISANDYEMCIDEDCVLVTSLEHVTYKTYAAYKKDVLKTKKFVDKRYQKLNNKKRK